MNLLQKRWQPRPSSSCVAKRQELVPARNCGRMGQENVLNVVELELAALHVNYCIWSSASENAAFNLSAFLISRALTYGYSPYSRKLGQWWSRTNLTNDDGLVFQSFGKPSRFSRKVLMWTPLTVMTRISSYSSKS